MYAAINEHIKAYLFRLYVNYILDAFQYAAILMGISNTIGTIPGIISPQVTGFIVKDRVRILCCF